MHDRGEVGTQAITVTRKCRGRARIARPAILASPGHCAFAPWSGSRVALWSANRASRRRSARVGATGIDPTTNSPFSNWDSLPEIRGERAGRIVAIVVCRWTSIGARPRRAEPGSAPSTSAMSPCSSWRRFRSASRAPAVAHARRSGALRRGRTRVRRRWRRCPTAPRCSVRGPTGDSRQVGAPGFRQGGGGSPAALPRADPGRRSCRPRCRGRAPGSGASG